MSAMTTENTPRDFGHYLQSCRRAKGISLEDVSRITRITVSVLNNIESEDSARLPFYSREIVNQWNLTC